MMRWTWLDVAETLKFDSHFDRPGWEYIKVNGRVLLNLLPALEKQVSDYDIGPFLSHRTLCLSFRSSKEVIGLYGINDSEIQVTRFYLHDFSPYHKIIIKRDFVLEEIQKYINQINTP